MIDLSRDSYTHEEVRDALHSSRGARTISFKYDLLDKNDNFLSSLETVEKGEISQSAFANIKRTAKFTVSEESYYSERYMTWGDVRDKEWSEL